MKQGSFNPLQLLFALGAIMAFLFLPVVGFGLTGIFTMGPNGLTLVSHGFDLFWLPLGVYVLMALSSFGTLQKISLPVALLALVTAVLFGIKGLSWMFAKNNIKKVLEVLKSITSLLTFIPGLKDHVVSDISGAIDSAQETIDVILPMLKMFYKMGTGLLVDLLCIVLYAVARFVSFGRIIGTTGPSAYGQGGGASSGGVYGGGMKL